MKAFDAVILSAGTGSRLMPTTRDLHKVLMLIGDKPLLWYSIQNLLDVGVSRIYIVVGHLASQFEIFRQTYFKNEDIRFVYNDRYNETNNLYSYYLCRKYIEMRNYFRLEADILYTRSILERLVRSTHPITVAVHRKRKEEQDEFSVKVNTSNKTILDFGKTIRGRKAFGEAKGIEFIRSEASPLVVRALLSREISRNLDKFSEYAYKFIIQQQNNIVYYSELLPGEHWYELDNAVDFRRLEKVINIFF